MAKSAKQQAYYLLKAFNYDFYQMKHIIMLESGQNENREFNYILCTTTAKSFVYRFDYDVINRAWSLKVEYYKDVFSEDI